MSLRGLLAGSLAIAVFVELVRAQATAPVKVSIQDDKPSLEEALPLDPVKRVVYQLSAGMSAVVQSPSVHLGQMQTLFKYDERIVYPAGPQLGRVPPQPMPLPKTRSGKARDGVMQSFQQGQMHITQTVEVVPSKPAKAKTGDKRRLDAVLVRYTLENKDTRPHDVGVRMFMIALLGNSRQTRFAAPNQPGKILNGVELKDGQVPAYLQMLQRDDLKDPGVVTHLTCRFQRKWEAPNRVVLTRIGAGGDGWNINALPAGDSAIACYWDPAPIKPGGKRELALGYGQGIATAPDSGGRVALAFGGSFEPGKVFTITAQVEDAIDGQALTLELPDGMERVEGKEHQPVPAATEDALSVVFWKARILRTGDFRLSVRSSTGVTVAKLISISRP